MTIMIIIPIITINIIIIVTMIITNIPITITTIIILFVTITTANTYCALPVPFPWIRSVNLHKPRYVYYYPRFTYEEMQVTYIAQAHS